VNIIPVDESGWGEVSDDLVPEKPEDLCKFKLMVSGLKDRFCCCDFKGN